MDWALEYYSDPVNTRVVVIGIAGITESEALRHIRDAGFSDCGVDFKIIHSSLVGAVFTRCRPVNVGPGSVIYNGGIGTPGPANQALLGGAVGGTDDRSVDSCFALSVAHLFNQVCHDFLSAVSFHHIGHARNVF